MSLDIPSLSLEGLLVEAMRHSPSVTLKEKVSVSLYTQGPSCRGDCGFCGWNRNFVPQLYEHRLLTKAVLQEKIAYAAQQNATLELMDNAIAVNNVSHATYVYTMTNLPRQVQYGINPGICMNKSWLADFHKAGALFYGNNLETSPRLFKDIVTTHTQKQKRVSLEHARDVGFKIHSGFILGIPGETNADYAEMLSLIEQLKPDALNLNFFFPIKGLPLAEHLTISAPEHMLRLICMFRITFPNITLYLGAGRSVWLQHLDKTALSIVDGFYSERHFLNHANLITTIGSKIQ